MWKLIKRIFLIINLKTVIITALSIASTSFCLHYDIKANFPLTLIGTAIVFPVVFSIGGAYKRREIALDEYLSISLHSIPWWTLKRRIKCPTKSPMISEFQGSPPNTNNQSNLRVPISIMR